MVVRDALVDVTVKENNMFWTRLLSSIVLTIGLGALVFFGDIPLVAALAVISILGMIEYFRARQFHKTGLAIMCYILAGLYYVLVYFTALTMMVPFVFLVIVVAITYYVLTYPKYEIGVLAEAVFGVFYIPVMLSFVFILHVVGSGIYIVWLVFLSAWANDVFAYCTGLLLGKHKLAPVLSPKKSVEGFIGGILGAALCGFLYALIFAEQLEAGLPMPKLVVPLLCAVGALFAVVGDLAASAIKRNCEIKDFGKLIPGHGGVLDRFDSIIPVAPLIFLVLTFISLF